MCVRVYIHIHTHTHTAAKRVLRRIDWQYRTDVSVQPIGSILQGQIVQHPRRAQISSTSRRKPKVTHSSNQSAKSALEGGEWSALHPNRFTPGERPGTHCVCVCVCVCVYTHTHTLHVKYDDTVGSVDDMIGYRLEGRALTPGKNFVCHRLQTASWTRPASCRLAIEVEGPWSWLWHEIPQLNLWRHTYVPYGTLQNSFVYHYRYNNGLAAMTSWELGCRLATTLLEWRRWQCITLWL